MTRPVIPLTRRQFLRGASGFALALPTLSSLLVEKAYGADPVFVRRPRLYWLATNHGAALSESLTARDGLSRRGPGASSAVSQESARKRIQQPLCCGRSG